MRAFVIRGFGEKAGVNFDWVHQELIAPALASVGAGGGNHRANRRGRQHPGRRHP